MDENIADENIADNHRDRQIDKFEEAWQRGTPPDIAHFVDLQWSTRDSLDRRLLVALVHIDLEYRWKSGEAVAVESYRASFPQFGEEPADILSLIESEYRFRRRREYVSIAEYEQRFPRWADVLREHLTAVSGEPGGWGTMVVSNGVRRRPGNVRSPLVAPRTHSPDDFGQENSASGDGDGDGHGDDADGDRKK